MSLKEHIRSKKLLPLLMSMLFLIAGIVLSGLFYYRLEPAKLAQRLEKGITEKSKELEGLLGIIGEDLSKGLKLSECRNLNNPGLLEKKGFLILMYQADTLSFWSDNTVPVPKNTDNTNFCEGFFHMGNGWFLMKEKYLPQGRLIALFLVKRDYPYENSFLINHFNDDLGIPEKVEISIDETAYPVRVDGNDVLFYLKTGADAQPSEGQAILLLFIFLTAYICFWVFFFRFFRFHPFFHNRQGLFLLLFSLCFVLVRLILFHFRIPVVLYNSKFFSPVYYATSSWLPSLGDLFVNAVLVLLISYFFFRNLRGRKGRDAGKSVQKAFFIRFTTYLVSTILFLLLTRLFNGLVLHSNIPLDLTNPINLNHYSVFAISCMAVLMLAWVLVSVLLVVEARRYPLTRVLDFSVLAVSLILWYLLSFSNAGISRWPYFVFLFIILSSISLATEKEHNIRRLPVMFFFIMLFSFYSTYLLTTESRNKEMNQRRLVAERLSKERDPVAEYLIQEMSSKMQNDQGLRKLLNHVGYSEILEDRAADHILHTYFDSFWSKYNIEVTVCTPEKMLNVIVPFNSVMNCREYFSGLIRSLGKPTGTPDLWFLDYGTESISYLAVFPFVFSTDGTTVSVTVYVDITSKIVPKGIGYPELLMSKEAWMNQDYSQYSYAIYKEGELVKSVGKYPYGLTYSADEPGPGTNGFTDHNGYSHYYFHAGDDRSVIVSLKNKTFLDYLTPFSYLILFYIAFSLLFFYIIRFPWNIRLQELNFRSRLQFAISMIILVSFVVIGIVSVIYIYRLNNKKNFDTLSEKTHSVLIEVQRDLAPKESVGMEMGNDLYYMLNNLSVVFFTDINLYDTQGRLLASSRPQIFEEGLLSVRLNRNAFNELSLNRKTMFIQDEKIGSYRFLSAYMPFRNQYDKVIGYLNLPYFAKQSEIRAEISSFLVAFINIYVILIALSIFFALFIAAYITQPLLLIRDKMSRLKLGKPNEKLEWRRNDEIGELVREYNNMIDKLSWSAEQLARSERESAWREMAKQVAHEIKNPLTPMKLSVQYLQKAYDEKAVDWDERLKRFTRTLVEQIDTLSEIASEFSDFAKMPEGRAEVIDLTDAFQTAVGLFREQAGLKINTIITPGGNIPVLLDKKHMLRVFTNLIRNSVQAIPPGREGQITIRVSKNKQQVEIAIEDNGCGIPQEQYRNIFTPNFTTKSGGMGLGLAIVRSIIEDADGTISFTSEEEKGTTFTINLPLAGTTGTTTADT